MNKHAFFDFDKTLLNGHSPSNFYVFLAEKKLIDNGPEILRMHEQVIQAYNLKQAIIKHRPP